jgi:hypothetical protein
VSYQPIHFSLPGVGMITVIGKQYEILTDDFIQQWLHDLARDYNVAPDYLLVSEGARSELRRIIMTDLYMRDWAMQYAQDEQGERAERYPNKVTGGQPLTIVVFPGLPEKTLCLASMLTMVSEEVEVQGATRVATRSYDRQWH